MYYAKMDNDNSIEFLASISDSWKGEMQEMLSDGSTEERFIQEGNTYDIPDTDEDGFQPTLSTTTVQIRPPNL